MAEPELFGIGISTVANFGVALGTVLLAYFTYKSVKASEEQVKLARNTIEKPRILEKIQKTLNGIKNEMQLDLREIQRMEAIWCLCSTCGWYGLRPKNGTPEIRDEKNREIYGRIFLKNPAADLLSKKFSGKKYLKIS